MQGEAWKDIPSQVRCCGRREHPEITGKNLVQGAITVSVPRCRDWFAIQLLLTQASPWTHASSGIGIYLISVGNGDNTRVQLVSDTEISSTGCHKSQGFVKIKGNDVEKVWGAQKNYADVSRIVYLSVLLWWQKLHTLKGPQHPRFTLCSCCILQVGRGSSHVISHQDPDGVMENHTLAFKATSWK